MIIIRITGGLGNQMFQYAAGRATALRTNNELILNTGFFSDGQEKQSHETKLHIKVFPAIQAQRLTTVSTEYVRQIELNSHSRVQRIIDRVCRKIGLATSYQIIQEPNLLTYQPNFHMHKARTLNLMSDWQNEKYFAAYEKIIRNDFRFPPLTSDDINSKLLAIMQNSQSVSIHVRRGDYLTSALHLPTPTSYYLKAIEMIRSKVRNPSFFVFSDDISWSKENLELPHATYINHNTGEHSHIDMQLMSNCKHNIIANSSFSWWGAWLNANSEKIVITPRMWLEKLGIESKNIIPETWISL